MTDICKFNKMGYCKFKDHCRYMHVNDICEDEECNAISCRKRHPKLCFYFDTYKRCKFGQFCRFLHKETNGNDALSKENENLVLRTIELESEIQNKNEKISKLEKETEQKDKRIKQAEKQIEENYKTIKDLNHQVEAMEQEKGKLKDGNREKDDQIRRLERDIHHFGKKNNL